MRTPGVILRSIDHTGPHRIEVDVADQFQQVTIAVDKDSLVAPLEEMAGSLLPPVDPAGVAEGKILQAPLPPHPLLEAHPPFQLKTVNTHITIPAHNPLKIGTL